MFATHRDEVAALTDGLDDPAIRLQTLSYPELWSEWTTQATPAWLAAHVAELRARYAVTI